MKKILILVVAATLYAELGHSQMAGQLFQGTLKQGSEPNTIKAVIKSSATFSGRFSNVQFTFQLPDNISPQPIVKIKNNPLESYIPAASYVTQVTNEGGFNNYLFAAAPTGQPAYNFVAGTEIDALEVQLIGRDTTGVTARLGSLSNGGSTGQLNFYIEVGGNDNTNSASMFYLSSTNNNPVNGGSYSAYSYVPYTPVALPLKMVSFNVLKNGDNAVLSWAVENQTSSNSHFEIERSPNGTLFTGISKLNVLNDGSTTNTYTYTDPNISTVKNNNGFIYYRLKQVDKDGEFVYTEIKKVQVKAVAFNLGILNNPIKASTLNLTIKSQLSGKGSLRIFNSEGKMVHQSTITWGDGYTEQGISLSNLSSGNYIANLVFKDEQYQVKFIK